MVRRLRVYQLGKTFKYVSTKDLHNNFVSINYNRLVNKDKLQNNIIRAKTKIKDLILCNDFHYFVTITCNGNKSSRYNLDEIRLFVNQRIRNLRKRFPYLHLYFLFIGEKHKKGGYHLHGVLSGDFYMFLYINKNGFDSLNCFDDLGYSTCEFIENKEKVSSYITKYITKEFAAVQKGKHLYFCSKGLKKPILLKVYDYDNMFFDICFFDIMNDYCYLKYSNKLIRSGVYDE